jgi:hypothetical protein
LKGRSTHWFADVMYAIAGDDDDDDPPDRVIAALGLACDGKVLEYLVEEAEELDEPPERDYPHIQARQTEGAFYGGGGA